MGTLLDHAPAFATTAQLVESAADTEFWGVHCANLCKAKPSRSDEAAQYMARVSADRSPVVHGRRLRKRTKVNYVY